MYHIVFSRVSANEWQIEIVDVESDHSYPVEPLFHALDPSDQVFRAAIEVGLCIDADEDPNQLYFCYVEIGAIGFEIEIDVRRLADQLFFFLGEQIKIGHDSHDDIPNSGRPGRVSP